MNIVLCFEFIDDLIYQKGGWLKFTNDLIDEKDVTIGKVKRKVRKIKEDNGVKTTKKESSCNEHDNLEHLMIKPKFNFHP